MYICTAGSWQPISKQDCAHLEPGGENCSAKESVMYHALCFLSNGVEVVDGVTIRPEKEVGSLRGCWRPYSAMVDLSGAPFQVLWNS